MSRIRRGTQGTEGASGCHPEEFEKRKSFTTRYIGETG
jgi:hypothetical protein